MKKFLFFTPIFFLLNISIAQAQPKCAKESINVELRYNVNPLVIDNSKKHNNLPADNLSISSTKHHTLGVYSALKELSVVPSYTATRSAFSKIECVQTKKVVATLTLKPTIYIASQLGRFPCTHKRVYAHEMEHYQIETNALQALKPYIQNILTKTYENSFYSSSSQETSKIISQKGQWAMNQIFDALAQRTKPQHARIDTDENYSKEAKGCSQIENQLLLRTLSGG